jgi:hypothetical protein
MSNALTIGPNLRSRGYLKDEISRRRTAFCAGCQIRLSDGQFWTLPASQESREPTGVASRVEYIDIIRAIMESEDASEQCIAKLALAIFLLHYNYDLAPDDYQRLLGSSTSQKSVSDWRSDFNQIAQEHVRAFLSYSGHSLVN